MKPPPFAYARPESLDETLELLAEADGTAVVLAGGQSLVPMLNFRVGAPETLVDINGLPGLDSITLDGAVLRIGALARQASAIASDIIEQFCPVVAAAAKQIGHVPIRNRGTVGGSIAHADPASELPCVAALLDAQVELTSRKGVRRISFEDFMVGPLMTVRRPDELVTAIDLTPLPGAAYGFAEIAHRAGDFALAGAAAAVVTDTSGGVATARIALFGVEAVPRRLPELESSLTGGAMRDVLAGVAAEVEREVEPLEDDRIPSDYRRRLAGVAVERALAAAGECGT